MMAIVENIRNFCIIAHIDHGKSTLADRFLELTGTVEKKKLHKQYLDLMDLEQEKGITIKLTPVRMGYTPPQSPPNIGGETKGGYILNLIDTPGHVDFTYEVSRSLAACEGAIVVVDATQGIEAQTLANIYLAMEQNLTLIPVLNKIDLPSAEIERVKKEIIKVLGFKEEEIIAVSAKEGTNVERLIEEVIVKVPPPEGELDKPARALIFDSKYDSYKGAVAYIRVIDGTLKTGDKIFMLGEKTKAEVLEIGVFTPQMKPVDKLTVGEVGYIASGLKDVSGLRVGDTITLDKMLEVQALPGYKLIQPKVFAGIFPVAGDDYHALREAMDKLALNDSSLQFEPENSVALGFGFRCGFLGLLHMDIVQERLEREYDLDLIFTAPNVRYQMLIQGEKEYRAITNPSEFPDEVKIEEVLEPWVKLSIICPSRYIGDIMELVRTHRGNFLPTEYLDEDRVNMHFEVPLSEVVIDFYDQLKSISQGYASMDYEPIGMRAGDLQKLKILVHNSEVDAFAQIVPRGKAVYIGREVIKRLKETLPKQWFEFKIQAMLGAKIIATERKGALRKDVIAKLYGGDRTRKDKLLKKQKKGKKRMKMIGSVEVPQEAFMVMLKRE